ncbi:MAG TPA: substrate-binding domain-containing protein [Gammaproteobacteria bacterium]|nr:substrate-binding domain-containing protein [Gammaproteobacteria bacterium]
MTHRADARKRAALRCAAALGAMAWFMPAAAQTVVVLSSNGVRAPVEDLTMPCTRAAGRPVSVTYGTSASIRQRITGGEAVDAVLATTEVVGELAKGGHLDSSSSTPLGRAGIGLGVRAGAPRHKIGTAVEIKQALLGARSVTYAADGASRPHIERMFERLGIASEMKGKAVLEQGSTRAAERVVAGDAEILLTLVSEILPVEGLELLGPVPAEFQSYISFAGAVGAHAASREAARAFIDCVAAPAAAATFTAQGIER